MIFGGTFPQSAIDSGLRSLVAGLNARHPGYRWEVVPLRDDERPLLIGEEAGQHPPTLRRPGVDPLMAGGEDLPPIP